MALDISSGVGLDANQQKYKQEQQQPLIHEDERDYLLTINSSNEDEEGDEDDDDDTTLEYLTSRNNHHRQKLHKDKELRAGGKSSAGGDGSGGIGGTFINGIRTRTFLPRRYSRRLTRFIVICGTILVLLLFIYIPLFNTIHSRLASIPGWSLNTSLNTADYVQPDLDTTLIQPQFICRSKFFLLIVVCSAAENFAARQNIRETWGNVSEFNYPMFWKMHSHLTGEYLEVKELSLRMFADNLHITNVNHFNETSHHKNLPVRIVFLIGKPSEEKPNFNETTARIRLEAAQYDDLLQENFYDTYNNLTIKSVMMLKWTSQQCNNRANFLMKCDDDTFVNVPNLLHLLLGGTIPVLNATVEFYDSTSVKALLPSNRLTTNHDFLIGYMFCAAKPISDTSNKWYSPMYMYKGDTYPNYLSGASYVMSFDVVPRLFSAALNTSLLHLEDVYVTGICAQKINLRRRHHPLFSFGHSTNKCTYRGTITQHYLKGDLMRDIYSFVTNTTVKCMSPQKYFRVKRLKKRVKSCQ